MLRIIDNRKDYYDSVRFAGGFYAGETEKPYVLVRDCVGVAICDLPIFYPLRPLTFRVGLTGYGYEQAVGRNTRNAKSANGNEVTACTICVVFAGVAYNGVRFVRTDSDSLGFPKPVVTCCWSDDAVRSYLEKHVKNSTGSYSFVESGFWYDESRIVRGDKFFEPKQISLDIANFLAEKKAPIVLIEPDYMECGHLVTLNYNSLDSLQFYNVKDAYTAYQELDQWFGSIAFPENPMVTISDEVKLEKRGFDRKISFRKRKGD